MAEEGLVPRPLRIGLVASYPPARCGVATFAASLARAMRRALPHCRLGVIACVDDSSTDVPQQADVVAELVAGSAESRRQAVDALRDADVVLVQHDFESYGGEDGAEVIDLVWAVNTPVIVTLHAVPQHPTPAQREIVERLAELADRLVVPSGTGHSRLVEQYGVESYKLRTIPHGARVNLAAGVSTPDGARTPVVLTWGLTDEQKGIELGIEAIAELGDLLSPPRYVVLGPPHRRASEPQARGYREFLQARAAQLGIGDRFELDDAFHETRALLRRIRNADVVLLPHRSRDEVVSAVLVEAIASGKPVVATRFPHAEELLGEGAGLLVPHDDAAAIAAALRRLLTDDALYLRTATSARRLAGSFAWQRVAAAYLDVIEELAAVWSAPTPSTALGV